MRLEEFISALAATERMDIRRTDGIPVAPHFHITEIGKTTRTSIDCGGNPHENTKATLQLHAAQDYEHRLSPAKILSIIETTQGELGLSNEELEVEYQIDPDTMGIYGLENDNGVFQLTSKHTDCLAKSDCGIPESNNVQITNEPIKNTCCSPEAACC